MIGHIKEHNRGHQVTMSIYKRNLSMFRWRLRVPQDPDQVIQEKVYLYSNNRIGQVMLKANYRLDPHLTNTTTLSNKLKN